MSSTDASANEGWRSRWRLTYTGGDWLALAGPSAAVLLQPASAQWSELIGTIWEDVLAAEGIEDLLARMAAFRLEGMPSFAALFWGPDGVRSLARGAIRLVDADTGDVLLDGAGVQTWTEASLRSSTRVRITTGAGPTADPALELPLLIGAAAVSEVIVETGPQRQVGTRQGAVAEAAPAEPHPEPVPVRTSADQAVGASVAPETDPSARTAALPTAALPPAEEPSSADPSSAEPSSEDRLAEEGHTIIAPSLPGAPAAPGPLAVPTAAYPAPTAEDDDEHGHTLLAPNLPGGPMLPPTPAPRRVVAVLRPSSGGQVEVDRPVLIGRAPSANRVSGGQLPRLLTVPSPSHDISRTHLQVAPGDGQVLVTDMNSTNGTLVTTADGRRLTLEPSAPEPLDPGAVIDLGDGVTIVVEPAPTEALDGGADR
ncbi:hypothetical protein FHX74_001024 [Friedmanniella endophytica]|uniref:FHA domain-containing protein n=1 Tax=Microlunatus kandeliicorticis TaxID=1759536 RepID=A0A7W3IQM5_9ACTN|nr:FHA domain-containing protein [Microlunatus kandeliicorticis]MBA8793419.1 hypothetical protein [Microlunatus kandeliicorticis]